MCDTLINFVILIEVRFNLVAAHNVFASFNLAVCSWHGGRLLLVSFLSDPSVNRLRWQNHRFIWRRTVEMTDLI